jgi:hypothetical protein
MPLKPPPTTATYPCPVQNANTSRLLHAATSHYSDIPMPLYKLRNPISRAACAMDTLEPSALMAVRMVSMGYVDAVEMQPANAPRTNVFSTGSVSYVYRFTPHDGPICKVAPNKSSLELHCNAQVPFSECRQRAIRGTHT